MNNAFTNSEVKSVINTVLKGYRFTQPVGYGGDWIWSEILQSEMEVFLKNLLAAFDIKTEVRGGGDANWHLMDISINSAPITTLAIMDTIIEYMGWRTLTSDVKDEAGTRKIYSLLLTDSVINKILR